MPQQRAQEERAQRQQEVQAGESQLLCAMTAAPNLQQRSFQAHRV